MPLLTTLCHQIDLPKFKLNRVVHFLLHWLPKMHQIAQTAPTFSKKILRVTTPDPITVEGQATSPYPFPTGHATVPFFQSFRGRWTRAPTALFLCFLYDLHKTKITTTTKPTSTTPTTDSVFLFSLPTFRHSWSLKLFVCVCVYRRPFHHPTMTTHVLRNIQPLAASSGGLNNSCRHSLYG